MLGELKRYIRYNSLKITFLKIRTKFFSRLRNRGFKKIWLKKQFATLKYEDREKLMTEKRSDSSLSHSACQTLIEKKAESLSSKRSRLADNGLPTNNNDKSLFPMIPHQRGTNNQEVQNLPVKKQATDISNVVPQGLPREKLHSGFLLEKTATTAETTSREAWRKKSDEEER